MKIDKCLCGDDKYIYAKRCRECFMKWQKTNRPELSAEGRKRLSTSKMRDKNPMWKGDKVSYISLHQWVEDNKAKPKCCEICKNKPPRDLANLSGKYKRDVSDFRWLCRSCHTKMDYELGHRIRKKDNQHKKEVANGK